MYLIEPFIEELRQITSDGSLSGNEVYHLACWLNEHPEIMRVWPGSLFVEPLNQAFADGHLDETEMDRIGHLIREVELEWSLLNGTAQEPEPISLDATQMLAVTMPFIDRTIEIPSNNSDSVYWVNLSDCSCTCGDWAGGRANIPVGNINRCCKHVLKAMLAVEAEGLAVLPDWLRAVAQECANRDCGFSPESKWLMIVLPSYDESKPVIVSWNETSEWCSVYAPAHAGYQRFGYNSAEIRWAYGIAPNGGRQIAFAVQKFRRPDFAEKQILCSKLSQDECTAFLAKAGVDAKNMDQFERELLYTRVLRPADYAICQTFKRTSSLHPRHLDSLRIAILNSEICKNLPRYGPHSSWDDLQDPKRPLTREERMLITDLASKVLPPQVFLALESNGVKKYKQSLDAKLRILEEGVH